MTKITFTASTILACSLCCSNTVFGTSLKGVDYFSLEVILHQAQAQTPDQPQAQQKLTQLITEQAFKKIDVVEDFFTAFIHADKTKRHELTQKIQLQKSNIVFNDSELKQLVLQLYNKNEEFNLTKYQANRILLHAVLTPFTEWSDDFSYCFNSVLDFLDQASCSYFIQDNFSSLEKSYLEQKIKNLWCKQELVPELKQNGRNCFTKKIHETSYVYLYDTSTKALHYVRLCDQKICGKVNQIFAKNKDNCQLTILESDVRIFSLNESDLSSIAKATTHDFGCDEKVAKEWSFSAINSDYPKILRILNELKLNKDDLIQEQHQEQYILKIINNMNNLDYLLQLLPKSNQKLLLDQLYYMLFKDDVICHNQAILETTPLKIIETYFTNKQYVLTNSEKEIQKQIITILYSK